MQEDGEVLIFPRLLWNIRYISPDGAGVRPVTLHPRFITALDCRMKTKKKRWIHVVKMVRGCVIEEEPEDAKNPDSVRPILQHHSQVQRVQIP